MTVWNLADALETLRPSRSDQPAIVQGDETLTWGEVHRRADVLARDLVDAGLGHQARVAAYLRNRPEYLETYLAAFKAGLVPVNTNFRYGPDEITYLFDNADAEAVVVEAEYLDVVEAVRDRLPRVRRWYVVGGAAPDWAVDHAALVGADASPGEPAGAGYRAPWGRSGDDLLFLYTGGTTGMPKGVMWRQDDLFRILRANANPVLGTTGVDHPDELVPHALPMVTLPACPLMHGTGQFSSLMTWLLGGTIVLLAPGHFDPAALFSEVERHGVNSIIIVGDAFARPMLTHLDATPGAHDLSSVRVITSSGVMWSQEVKDGLLAHLPDGAALFDSLGSSEGVGFGASVSARGHSTSTARFSIGSSVKVFSDDHREIAPGSPEAGFLALTGPIPVGYHKDPEKTARTFPVIDGVRYSVPGDYAQVEPDGTLVLLGRGSVCINTGGEKVYPEEVEEVIKRSPSVADAVCVGIPDERFGERIVALVEPTEPGGTIDPDALVAHVKSALAHYKAPRHVLTVETIGRAPNGKVDYRRLKQRAADEFAAPGTTNDTGTTSP